MAEKRKTYISPKGIAVYPWLGKPDTKWKPEGEYHIKLRVPGDDAAPLIEKLQPEFDAAIEEAKKNPKRKKGSKIVEQEFYRPVFDDNGDETGDVEFTFKMKASGVSKKSGDPWTRKPKLFGPDKEPLDAATPVYGGSICKVAFQVIPYDSPKATGIKLALEAVQVIKLVSSGGGGNASSYGFGDETDDEDADEPTKAGADTEGDGGDEDEDF